MYLRYGDDIRYFGDEHAGIHIRVVGSREGRGHGIKGTGDGGGCWCHLGSGASGARSPGKPLSTNRYRYTITYFYTIIYHSYRPVYALQCSFTSYIDSGDKGPRENVGLCAGPGPGSQAARKKIVGMYSAVYLE